MILSKLHKFVFLKGQKVAGTSVEMALSAICGPDDVITAMDGVDEQRRIAGGGRPSQNYANIDDPEAARAAERDYIREVLEASREDVHQVRRPPGRYIHHMKYGAVVRQFGSLEGYTVFGVDRNPYEKCLSLANMLIAYKHYRRAGDEMRGAEDRLEPTVDRILRAGSYGRIRNLKRYSDQNGRLRAKVLRYETLQADLDALVEEQGWPKLPPLPHAKKGIMAGDRDPAELLRRDQIDAINRAFADEFKAYGYARL